MSKMPVDDGLWRGLRYAIPISAVIWALIIGGYLGWRG